MVVFCGMVAAVFLWWCSCGGVQSTTPVLQSTTPYYKVLLRTTTPYYKVLLRTTTPYYKVLLQYYSVLQSTILQYYSVLQSTTPVLLRTTKYYSSTTEYYSVLQSTTPYYKELLPYYRALLRTTKYTTPVLLRTTKYTTPVLLQYHSVLQSTTPVLLRTTGHYSDLSNNVRTTSFQYYSVLRQYYKSFQNEHFVRGFRNFLRNKLPKRAFRARLPPNFTERASKTSVSRDASDNSHKKLAKSTFRATLLAHFTEKASKTIVSCEASSKFHRTSLKNDRFVRGFRQFSQKKLPKRAFRAMLPTIHTKSLQNQRFVRCFFHISQKKLPKRSFRARLPPNFHPKFAFRYSFARSTHRFLREGSSAKSNKCLALQRRAFPNFKMYVSLQRRAQKCMNLSTVNRPASRTQKCNVLLQFWAIDTTFLPRGLTESK